MSEGTVWFGAPGVIFTAWMDEKAFIPKLAAGKRSVKRQRRKERLKVEREDQVNTETQSYSTKKVFCYLNFFKINTNFLSFPFLL